MFLVRGLVFSHEAVREWEAKLTPALAENLRRRRPGKTGRSWYVDETYIKVQGRWCYLYRAIDRSGALVDVMVRDGASPAPSCKPNVSPTNSASSSSSLAAGFGLSSPLTKPSFNRMALVPS
jgi:hypothetical protein